MKLSTEMKTQSCVLCWQDSLQQSRSRNWKVFNWLESRTANRCSLYPTPGTILLSFLQFHNPDTFKTCVLHLSQLSFFVSTPSSGADFSIIYMRPVLLMPLFFSVRKNSFIFGTLKEMHTLISRVLGASFWLPVQFSELDSICTFILELTARN